MKIEVKFIDEWRVYHVVKSAVKDSISNILSTIPLFQHNQQFHGFNNSFRSNQNQEPINFNIFSESKTENDIQRAKDYISSFQIQTKESSVYDGSTLWQVHNKYIISQINSGLVIIDQHVAHERVLYEEALNAFDNTPLSAQTLLFSEELEFSPDEFTVLLEISTYLKKLGFRIKENGQNKILLEAIPSNMVWGNENTVIKDIIDNSSSYMEDLAASFACHAAVKAGDTLSMEEMQILVNHLFSTKHPYYCPHGRPIIVQLSLEELDKRFERI